MAELECFDFFEDVKNTVEHEFGSVILYCYWLQKKHYYNDFKQSLEVIIQLTQRNS
jgi:hypothetical protein